MLSRDNSLKLGRLSKRAQGELLRGMSAADLRAYDRAFATWAHAGQLEPAGDWRLWLMIAGRGYGKTRAGAEWIDAVARREGAGCRIALVAATIAEARAVMIDGESGLIAVAKGRVKPRFEATTERLVWSNGAQAFLYSGESPDRLRGPEHHVAWCDELAKWAKPDATWDMMTMGLRLGERPRVLVTTTPRPVPIMRRLKALPRTVVTGGPMAENINLPADWVEAMTQSYAGTRLGRQELGGELIEDADGTLWPREMLDACRVRAAPECVRVVIGVDPPGGSGPASDACGIVAAGLGRDGFGYVLADASVAGERPDGWARVVAEAYREHGGCCVIAEKNQGGEMVRTVLHGADAAMPVKLAHASRGKAARAEPVAALYERGKVFHVGAFPRLEDEMAGLTTRGRYEGPGGSPDRADALVWALTELMLGERQAEPWVRVL